MCGVLLCTEVRDVVTVDAERRRLEVFEVWCHRRMIRISWFDRVTNEVFRRTGEERSLWKNMVMRRDELIGHLV
jgi:hypothetical protein